MGQLSCAVEGCDKPSRTRGWCVTHYKRWAKTGDTGPAYIRPKVDRRSPRQCSVEGCDRPHNSLGLCASHYQRFKTTGTAGTAPIRAYLAAELRDEQGRKQCRVCLAWFEPTHFIKNSRTADGLDGRCRGCRRHEKLMANFGLTPARYAEMLAAQGGRCAVCATPPTAEEPLHVDHDHACCPSKGKSCGKCVRALLCAWCNRGIGMLRDDPELLRKAASYVERHRD